MTEYKNNISEKLEKESFDSLIKMSKKICKIFIVNFYLTKTGNLQIKNMKKK